MQSTAPFFKMCAECPSKRLSVAVLFSARNLLIGPCTACLTTDTVSVAAFLYQIVCVENKISNLITFLQVPVVRSEIQINFVCFLQFNDTSIQRCAVPQLFSQPFEVMEIKDLKYATA